MGSSLLDMFYLPSLSILSMKNPSASRARGGEVTCDGRKEPYSDLPTEIYGRDVPPQESG